MKYNHSMSLWRARSPKQQKDKMEIYNSREWKELRIAKLRSTDGLCEVCQQQGIVTAAHAVHHIHPIEDSSSKAEMRKWAFMWDNLVSVCDACHAKIHKEQGKGTKAQVKQRAEQRLERRRKDLMSRFLLPAHSESPYVDVDCEEVTGDPEPPTPTD